MRTVKWLTISLVIGWCLAIPATVVAQRSSTSDAIRSALQQYWSAVQRKDHVTTLDFIDPRLFALVPKERMLEALERASADTTVRVTLGDARVDRISKPITEGSVQYASVDYDYTMRMVLSSDPDTDEARKTEFLKGMLEEQYGKGRVQVEGPDHAFRIEAERHLIAVLDPSIGQWRFLERKKGMEPLLQQLVPAKVLKRLG